MKRSFYFGHCFHSRFLLTLLSNLRCKIYMSNVDKYNGSDLETSKAMGRMEEKKHKYQI